jgi:hypothetical protein
MQLAGGGIREMLGELDCAILAPGQSATLSGAGNGFVIRLEAVT